MKNKFKKYFLCLISLIFLISYTALPCFSIKNIIKIVITGGGCAGKTTSLPLLEKHFSSMGYKVYIINEIATSILKENTGPKDLKPVCLIPKINEENLNTRRDFQLMIAKTQVKEEEELISKIKKNAKDDKISLIICDRGLLDGKAFIENTEFYKIIGILGKNENEILNSYDAVFHMVSTSKYSKNDYINNNLRKESVETTRVIDDKLLDIYSNHPYRKIIYNFPSIEEKLDRLTKEIQTFLKDVNIL